MQTYDASIEYDAFLSIKLPNPQGWAIWTKSIQKSNDRTARTVWLVQKIISLDFILL